jgi:hypothetical protein
MGPKRIDRIEGTRRLNSRIISRSCMVESSFKFCMGDKLREKGEKRDETFFSAV